MLTLELALIHTACSHAAANDKANEEWGNERPVHFEKRNHDPCTARAAHILTHTTPDPKIRRPNKPAADMDPCAERAAALLAPATRALLLGHSACLYSAISTFGVFSTVGVFFDRQTPKWQEARTRTLARLHPHLRTPARRPPPRQAGQFSPRLRAGVRRGARTAKKLAR